MDTTNIHSTPPSTLNLQDCARAGLDDIVRAKRAIDSLVKKPHSSLSSEILQCQAHISLLQNLISELMKWLRDHVISQNTLECDTYQTLCKQLEEASMRAWFCCMDAGLSNKKLTSLRSKIRECISSRHRERRRTESSKRFSERVKTIGPLLQSSILALQTLESKPLTSSIAALQRCHRLDSFNEPFSIKPFHLFPLLAQPPVSGRQGIERDLWWYTETKERLDEFAKHFKDMGRGWVDGQVQNIQSARDLQQVYLCATQHFRVGLGQITRISTSQAIDKQASIVDQLLKGWNALAASEKLVIAVGGYFSHGKSSFINALIGEDVLPTSGASI